MARVASIGSLVLLMVLSTACTGGENVPTSGPPEATVAPADRDLVGRWVDASGRELPDGTAASNGILVLQTSVGSTTCTTEHVTVFIRLAWPVGRELDWNAGDWTDDDAPWFVRDPSGGGIKTYAPSDLDVDLPRTARPTGFRREGNSLSVDPEQVALYVSRPDGHTERWARVRPGEGCA